MMMVYRNNVLLDDVLLAFVPGHALGGGMVWGVGGRQTGARERVIKEDGSLGGWLTTTYYYNDEGQLLQEIREHYGNVKEYKSYAYDLREQVTRFRVRQLMAGVPVVEYDRYFTYDEEGRVLKVEQEMADDGQGRVVLAEHVYNELGQLESKRLHNGGDVEGVGYDLNGNLRRLLRRDGSGGVLHDLTYSYGNGANGNAVSGVRNGATVSSAYAYDANGNMTYDGMREVGVSYNYLNLPCEVGDVSYVYSTGGRKLGMEVGGVLTLYCGEVVYHGNPTETGESNALLVRHPEGFVKADFWGAKEYYYTLRDHLGSTRAVRKASVGGALSTVQRTEYYPFGLVFSYDDLDENKYLFSGKELQDAQVGGEMLNLYDFGARFYDPVLGRWMTKDPMEEEYYGLSGYVYCFNNPLIFVDPDGRRAYYDYNGNFLGVDDEGFSGEVMVSTFEDFIKMRLNGKSFSSMQPLQSANLSARAYSNVYTHILRTEGYDISVLEGGAIAVRKGLDEFNTPSEKVRYILTTFSEEGDMFTISIDQIKESTLQNLTTIENIINALGIHEYLGHGENKFQEKTHYKAYVLQMKHITWSKTTPVFQTYMKAAFYDTVKENNSWHLANEVWHKLYGNK